jgi:hypothetical protein
LTVEYLLADCRDFIKRKKGDYMASSIADMIKKAKEEVGASNESTREDESQDEGIQIERQNVDHVRGQAKSGK